MQQESKHAEQGGSEKVLNFSRLQEEHAKAIKLSKERIDKWAQFKADYEALQARMYTLPDKLTHDVMVPFGKFAFMPGELYDTNEIMVLLGDNWFVKRSVKQALEIAERRKQNVAKMLEDEKKQMNEWMARHAFTTSFKDTMEEHEDTVEIKEEYDEAKERKRKERRQHNVKSGFVPPPRPAFPKPSSSIPSSGQTVEKSHDTQTRTHPSSSKEKTSPKQRDNTGSVQSTTVPKSKEGTKMDKDLWARLDELEREEEEYLAKEKQEEEDEEEETVALSMAAAETSKVTVTETAATSRDEQEKRSGTTTTSSASGIAATKEKLTETTRVKKKVPAKSSGSTVVAAPLKISVKHTLLESDVPTKDEKVDKVELEQGEEKPLFTSPADIFKRFCKVESSDEDISEPTTEERDNNKTKAVTKTPSSPHSSASGKGVTWNPTLVEFSDGSRSKGPSAVEQSKKSDAVAKRGRGRGQRTGGRGKGEQKKMTTKPPMPFSGQVIERCAPMQPATSSDQGEPKKVSKFKASRK